MDRITVLVTLVVSLYSSRTDGSYPDDNGYLPPPKPCENVTINIASTMFVTATELLPPFVNTRVLEPDTSFKPMPQHTSTTTTIVTTLMKQRKIIKKYPGVCVTRLDPVTVTNTIPVFVTTFLPPLTITKASKMLVWMTVPPVTTTVLVTTTTKDDPKLKISVKTEFHNTTMGPDTVEMTMPITFTELLAPMTSTVTDHNVHTTTLPAITIQIPPEVIMKDPSTVTSTIIITHTEVIPADTKMVTWTITQMVNKECDVTYNYNSPTVAFPPPPAQTIAPAVPFVIQPVETRTLNPVQNEEEASGLPGNLFNVLNASTIWN